MSSNTADRAAQPVITDEDGGTPSFETNSPIAVKTRVTWKRSPHRARKVAEAAHAESEIHELDDVLANLTKKRQIYPDHTTNDGRKASGSSPQLMGATAGSSSSRSLSLFSISPGPGPGGKVRRTEAGKGTQLLTDDKFRTAVSVNAGVGGGTEEAQSSEEERDGNFHDLLDQLENRMSTSTDPRDIDTPVQQKRSRSRLMSIDNINNINNNTEKETPVPPRMQSIDGGIIAATPASPVAPTAAHTGVNCQQAIPKSKVPSPVNNNRVVTPSFVTQPPTAQQTLHPSKPSVVKSKLNPEVLRRMEENKRRATEIREQKRKLQQQHQQYGQGGVNQPWRKQILQQGPHPNNRVVPQNGVMGSTQGSAHSYGQRQVGVQRPPERAPLFNNPTNLQNRNRNNLNKTAATAGKQNALSAANGPSAVAGTKRTTASPRHNVANTHAPVAMASRQPTPSRHVSRLLATNVHMAPNGNSGANIQSNQSQHTHILPATAQSQAPPSHVTNAITAPTPDNPDDGLDDMDFLAAMCQAADAAQVSSSKVNPAADLAKDPDAGNLNHNKQPYVSRTTMDINMSMTSSSSSMANSHFASASQSNFKTTTNTRSAHPVHMAGASFSMAKSHFAASHAQSAPPVHVPMSALAKDVPLLKPILPHQHSTSVPLVQSVTCSEPGVKYARFKTSSVSSAVDQATGAPILRLFVSNRAKGLDAVVELKGQWATTPIQVNMRFNVVWDDPPSDGVAVGGALEERCQRRIIIDDEHNFLVLLPDILVSPSRIASASECMRRTVLGEKAPNRNPSIVTVMGNAKHELIERALERLMSDPYALSQTVLAAIREQVLCSAQVVLDSFAVELSEDQVRKALTEIFPLLESWGRKFIADKTGSRVHLRGQAIPMRVQRILATEEKVVSPVWGLKGQMDITALCTFGPPETVNSSWAQRSNMAVSTNGNPAVQQAETRDVVTPLEIKTGRAIQLEHHAQVALYALLAADRYNGTKVVGTHVPKDVSGMLLHAAAVAKDTTQTGGGTGQAKLGYETVLVPHAHAEIGQLCRLRNEFAAHVAPMKVLRKPRWDTGAAAAGPNGSIAGGGLEKQSSIQDGGGDVGGDVEDCVPKALPPVLGNVASSCVRCFSKTTCMLFHVATEGGTAESSGLPEQMMGKISGHLTPIHLKYFADWNRMLDFEIASEVGNQKELWTMSAQEREARGRCIADLKLESMTAIAGSEFKTGSFAYTLVFRRRAEVGRKIDRDEIMMDVGDFVSVSADEEQIMLVSGNIVSVDSGAVVVEARNALPLMASAATSNGVVWRVDKDQMLGRMHSIRSNLVALFQGASKFAADDKTGDGKRRGLVVDLRRPEYACVTQDDVTNGRVLKVLGSRVVPSQFWDGKHSLEQLRSVWASGTSSTNIRNSQPQQRHLQSPNNLSQSGTQFSGGPADRSASASPELLAKRYQSLNTDQRAAVSAVLCAKDYVCIQGMPGTGKTTTIGFLIAALHALGQSVLVSAYTHSAVDGLLTKVKEYGVPFVRVGTTKQIHPDVVEYSLDGLVCADPYVERLNTAFLERLVADPRLVVGGTCLSSHHPLIARKRFDVCIVDEAGQLTQPVCLGPLANAKVFVLVGDHNQLPPLVRSDRARELGMDVSLFGRLSEVHPTVVSKLALQFRMNVEIMTLANKLVYSDALRCGNNHVANRAMHLPKFPQGLIQHSNSQTSPKNKSSSSSFPASVATTSPWLTRTVDPATHVVFLDTEAGPGSNEGRVGAGNDTKLNPNMSGASAEDKRDTNNGLVVNEFEARVVRRIVDGLVACGANPADIGVISPYRSQLKLLRRRLQQYKGQLEVSTVDRYQGRDKLCIIVSLVRCNSDKQVGMLLKDWRRINVAFTRAKAKLVVIGSKRTLKNAPMLNSFVQLADERNWTVQLKETDVMTATATQMSQSPCKIAQC